MNKEIREIVNEAVNEGIIWSHDKTASSCDVPKIKKKLVLEIKKVIKKREAELLERLSVEKIEDIICGDCLMDGGKTNYCRKDCRSPKKAIKIHNLIKSNLGGKA